MTEKDILNKIKAEKDTITLIQLYKNDFVEILGNKGVSDLINQKLDELNYWRAQLEKIRENEKK